MDGMTKELELSHEDLFFLGLARQGKEESYAKPAYRYSRPASEGVKFDREKGEYMDRIKELLTVWAGYYQDGYGTGYPKQSAFANERVQNSNRSTETFREIPPDVERLNEEVEKLAPLFKQILRLEYRDKRPQKSKAAVLGMSREVFSIRLRFCHEQLNYAMWGM
jgi:hypothetical protein